MTPIVLNNNSAKSGHLVKVRIDAKNWRISRLNPSQSSYTALRSGVVLGAHPPVLDRVPVDVDLCQPGMLDSTK
jgi:hypothetical protein